MHPEFGKVVIFGVGLIGGSFALGLKAAEQVEEVVGFGRSIATLMQAQNLGLIARLGANAGQEVIDADLVLLATPVAQMPDIMARIAPYLGPNTVVTDGGSTKSDVVAEARQAFGEQVGQFVPAHPIAGAENSGAAAARGPVGHKRLSLVVGSLLLAGGGLLVQTGSQPILPALPQVAVQLLGQIVAVAFAERGTVEDRLHLGRETRLGAGGLAHDRTADTEGCGCGRVLPSPSLAATLAPLGVRL